MTKSPGNQKRDITIHSGAAEYLSFVAATGDTQGGIEMLYEDENIWLTQKMMAALYGVEVPTIHHHIQQIFEYFELEREATIRKHLIVQMEGKRAASQVQIYKKCKATEFSAFCMQMSDFQVTPQ